MSKTNKENIQAAFTDKVVALLEKRMGWSKSLISHYKNGTKTVSAKRAVIIESLVGIPVEIMRPDIFKRRKKPRTR